MIDDPETRRQIAKQGRLWLLALVCATVGTVAITRTGSLFIGIIVFLISVAVLGSVLWFYERRKRR